MTVSHNTYAMIIVTRKRQDASLARGVQERQGCESPPPPSCEGEGPCRPGFVRARNSCACLCPDGAMGCGAWCCADGLYCNPSDTWLRLCRTGDW